MPQTITPSRIVEGAAVDVTITGQGFTSRVYTDFDDPTVCSNADTLNALLDAWGAKGTYKARAAAVTALLAGHVHDDGQVDVLDGQGAKTLFFADPGDQLWNLGHMTIA